MLDYQLSSKALKALEAAGWSSDRHVVVDDLLGKLGDRGYASFPLIKEFLSSFCGIDVPSDQGGISCEPEIISSLFPKSRWQRLRDVVVEGVFPVGSTSL